MSLAPSASTPGTASATADEAIEILSLLGSNGDHMQARIANNARRPTVTLALSLSERRHLPGLLRRRGSGLGFNDVELFHLRGIAARKVRAVRYKSDVCTVRRPPRGDGSQPRGGYGCG